MIELEYFLERECETLVYQLIQFSPSEPWKILLDGELLGSITKHEAEWRQLNGEKLQDYLFDGITRLIDAQNFNGLPQEILSRWGNYIEQVLPRSDREYLVVCRAEISFKTFERVFSRFVSDLLKDEWLVEFKVFNHDFSEDFTVLAKPVVWRKEVVGW